MPLFLKIILGLSIFGLVFFLLIRFEYIKIDQLNLTYFSKENKENTKKDQDEKTQEDIDKRPQIAKDNDLVIVSEIPGSRKPSKSREIICKTNLTFYLEEKGNERKFEKVLFDLNEHPYLWVDRGTECFNNSPNLVISHFKNGYQWLNKFLELVPYKEDFRPEVAKKYDLIEIQSVKTYSKQSSMDKLYCKSNIMVVNIGSTTPNYGEKVYEKVYYDAFYFISTWVSKDTVCSSYLNDYTSWWNSGYSELSSGGEIRNINQTREDNRPEKAKANDMMPIEEVKGYSNVQEMAKLYCVASKIYIPNATTGKEVVNQVYFDVFYYPKTWVTKDASCGSGEKFYKKYKDKGFKFLSSGGEIT